MKTIAVSCSSARAPSGMVGNGESTPCLSRLRSLIARLSCCCLITMISLDGSATAIVDGYSSYYGPFEITSDLPPNDGWVVTQPERFYTTADAENSRGEHQGQTDIRHAEAKVTWASTQTTFFLPGAPPTRMNESEVSLQIPGRIFASAGAESIGIVSQEFRAMTTSSSPITSAAVFITAPSVGWSVTMMTDKYGERAAFLFDALLELWEVDTQKMLELAIRTSGTLAIGPNSSLSQVDFGPLSIWGATVTVKPRTDYLAVLVLHTFGEVFNIPIPSTTSLLLLGCLLMPWRRWNVS